jgi:hypothetical protein
MSGSRLYGRAEKVMRLYYFSVWDGARVFADDEGVDLADLPAARTEACSMAGELMRGHGCDRRHWTIEVRDESRSLLCDVVFATVR